jgi:hypothetical protein
MKPGDLRRFKDGLRGSGGTERVSGQPFVVINIHPYSLLPHALAPGRTDFLVGGRIETGWSLMWVMNNSEVISEAG